MKSSSHAGTTSTAPHKLGNYKEAADFYETGKHRRYELLFAVNGGAFAIARLFAERDAGDFLGGLTLKAVAWGMSAFSMIMLIDIFVFGQRIRQDAGDAREWEHCHRGIFSVVGKAVLVSICGLLAAAWILVAANPVG